MEFIATLKAYCYLMMIALFFYVINLLVVHATASDAHGSDGHFYGYGYQCLDNKCTRIELNAESVANAITLPVCQLFCGYQDLGRIWPTPSGIVRSNKKLQRIDLNAVAFTFPNVSKQISLWEANKERFIRMLHAEIPNVETLMGGGDALHVIIELTDNTDDDDDAVPRLTLETVESYSLQIAKRHNATVVATIIAPNFFGARHGLETLLQLIVYDDIRDEVVIVAEVQIEDAPAFKWRGLALDTSRNFYSVSAIKRTIDTMAMVKLNTFHWHITDSQSFPLELKSHPEMAQWGAYSKHKIYTHVQIRDIVEYGRVRGVRVMPEFDAPAHVGEGWQHKNMTACVSYEPWRMYCGEPPCGQLDPTVDDVYTVLEDIYGELFELFQSDVFHMGGDEVDYRCWESSNHITQWMKKKGWGLQEEDFIRLWNYFQQNALERVDRVASNGKTPPIILWTSDLTAEANLKQYLNSSRYIIQIWSNGEMHRFEHILSAGFRVIFSNHDALYFDCGGPAWLGTKSQNWCSPYKAWWMVYNNNLNSLAGNYSSLVLGAEAAIWSEQIGEGTLDARLWPRASALAERLWTNPNTDWNETLNRMLYHRERLAIHGIQAETLQPEWCLQNRGGCS